MTYEADTKEEWVKAWKKEISYLYKMYQCLPNGLLYTRLDTAIKEVMKMVDVMADKLEEEGEWRERKLHVQK